MAVSGTSGPVPPHRQVRAVFDDETITVYQAYSPAIADAALAAQTFVAPFKVERMTWVKPSFLWMMYRCGWGAKEGQERVLAVRITRAGFEDALARACLSHPEPGVDADESTWRRRKVASPVRVQWDPERDLALDPLPWRSVQVGLGGPTVRQYVDEWIVAITDVTALAHEVHRTADASLLPDERPYPLPDDVAQVIGASR